MGLGVIPLAFFLLSACGSKEKVLAMEKAKTPAELEELAQEFYSLKDYPRAIAVYQKLIRDYGPRKDRYGKKLAWAHYEIGFCYMVQNKLDEAEKFYQLVISDFPEVLAPRILAEQRIEELERLRNPEPNRIKKFFLRLSPKYRAKMKAEKKAKK